MRTLTSAYRCIRLLRRNDRWIVCQSKHSRSYEMLLSVVLLRQCTDQASHGFNHRNCRFYFSFCLSLYNTTTRLLSDQIKLRMSASDLLLCSDRCQRISIEGFRRFVVDMGELIASLMPAGAVVLTIIASSSLVLCKSVVLLSYPTCIVSPSILLPITLRVSRSVRHVALLLMRVKGYKASRPYIINLLLRHLRKSSITYVLKEERCRPSQRWNLSL